MSRKTGIFDALLEFKDAGLVASSAAAQVDSSNKIVTLGDGFFRGDMIIDVTACEVDSGNEIYTIGIQVSDSATFASTYYEVASLKLGDAAAIPGDVDMVEGRYILPFTNTIVDSEPLKYARIYTTVAGTVGTGINFTAWAYKVI